MDVRFRFFRWLACCAAVMTVSVAHVGAVREAAAQTEDEKRAAGVHFNHGTQAFAKKEYRRAADEFEAAWKLAPHAAALYNAGLAWQALGDKVRAADAFDIALRAQGMDDDQRGDARRRLAELEEGLTLVELDADAGAKIAIAHAESLETPARVHVSPGQYDAVATCAGGRTVALRVMASGRIVHVKFDPCSAPSAASAAVAPSHRLDSGPSKDAESSSRKAWAWGTLGLAAVFAGAAIGAGVKALDARDEFNDSQQTSQGAHDRAASLRLWTNVAWGAAALSGGAGAYLLVSSPRAAHSAGAAAVRPGLVLTPSAAFLRLAF
jgi:tetratricopeptide (TPR) repeat protein